MPVKPDSRYADRPILRVAAPDGSQRDVVALRLRRPTASGPSTRHRLRPGDALDLLARRVYGEERLWWRILDANPVVHPLDLESGDGVDVPAPGPATRVTRARRF